MRRTLVSAAQFALGNGLYMALGVYWTLALPKQLSLVDFADWRIFVLYNSFVGVLHIGALDALVYRWSRRTSDELPGTLWDVVAVLVIWQLAILAAWVAIAAAFHLSGVATQLGILLLVFALVWNVSTALQYALQAAKRFLACSVFVAVHALVFVAGIVFGWFRGSGPLSPSWGFTYAAALATLVALVPAVGLPAIRRLRIRGTLPLIRDAVRTGFQVLLVNTLLILLVNADRIATSLAFPRTDFAIYAFAASLMALVNTVTSVASRFFVPYVTGWVQRGRFAEWYERLTWLIFGCWAAMVGAGLAARPLVVAVFPKYEASLPLAAAMLLGVAFGIQVQVLHLAYARAARRTTQSTRAAVAAVVVALVVLPAATYLSHTLMAVAMASVVVALAWWAIDAVTVLGTAVDFRGAPLRYLGAVLAVAAGAMAASLQGRVWELVAAAACLTIAIAAIAVTSAPLVTTLRMEAAVPA